MRYALYTGLHVDIESQKRSVGIVLVLAFCQVKCNNLFRLITTSQLGSNSYRNDIDLHIEVTSYLGISLFGPHLSLIS